MGEMVQWCAYMGLSIMRMVGKVLCFEVLSKVRRVGDAGVKDEDDEV